MLYWNRKIKKLKELEEELSNAIVEMTDKEAELEIASSLREEMELLTSKLESAEKKLNEMNQDNTNLDSIPVTPTLSDSEKNDLLNEISQLKADLDKAKSETSSVPQDDQLLALQGQLSEAVSETIEMQTELEETQARLAQIESGAGISSSPEISQVIENAKQTENQALQRIGNLTAALRNSEQLRKEMESLLLASDQTN
jgi:hypothetical protein